MSYVPGTDYRNLLVEADEAVARITLNRPEKRNALSLELMDELIAALREASARHDARDRDRGRRTGLLGRARPVRDDRPR